MSDSFDNTALYVEINKDFTAKLIEGGEAFWSGLAEQGDSEQSGLVVMTLEYTGDLTTREMHPGGDEIITLLEGELTFIFNPGNAEEKRIDLKEKDTVIIPKGVWHTVLVARRSMVQHILMGKGSQIKSVDAQQNPK